MGISYTRSFLPSQNILLVSIDPLISEQEQEKIVIACQSYSSAQTSEFFKSLGQQFPQIKSVAVTQQPCGINKIAIASYAPQARINDNMIVTELGALEPASHYNSSFTQQLVTISVPDTKHDSLKELVSYIQISSPNVCQQFEMSWMRPTNIILRDKQQKNFIIACDDSRILEQSCVEKCETIYREMKEANKKKTQHVVTDVRFDHQIIAYLKEGEFHGHHII